MSFKDLLIAKEDFSFIPKEKDNFEVWMNKSSDFIIKSNQPHNDVWTLLFAHKTFADTYGLTSKQFDQIKHTIKENSKHLSLAEARHYVGSALNHILDYKQLAFIDLTLQRKTGKYFYIANSHYPVNNQSLMFSGLSGAWEISATDSTQIAKNTTIPSFNTRPQLLSFLHDYIAENLYTIYTKDKSGSKSVLAFPPQGKLWWKQFIKPEIDLQQIFS